MSSFASVGSVGELLVEFVCTSRNGRHRKAGAYAGPYPSGAPAIFIDQAAQVGGRCVFVGAVGDDAFGQVELERLAEHGVDTRLITIHPGFPTGSAFVSYNDDGSRDFVYNITHSAASRFETNDATTAALLDFGLDALHVSGSALADADMAQKVLRLATALHGAGVAITFDPNVRKELVGNPAYFRAVEEMMRRAAIFLPSEEDAEALFPGRALEDYASELFASGARAVALKRGGKGSQALSRDGEQASFGAHDVTVLDPTGAGDCFCATFVTLWLKGAFGLRDALARANAAGALAVTKVGPMEGNSDLAAIEALLRKSS